MANKPPKLTPAPQQYVPPEDSIGERIKRRREELRINYEELARLTVKFDYPDCQKGLTPTMLARYEKGVDGRSVLPGTREFRILCKSLNVSADWLLFGSDANKQAVEITAALLDLFNKLVSHEGIEGDGKRRAEENFEHDQKLRGVKKSST